MTGQPETTSLFCTACGAPLQPAAKWCTHCGTRVDGAAPRREDLRTLVTLTEWADEWHSLGLVDDTSYARVQQHLGERIAAIQNAANVAPQSAAASTSQPAAAPEPSVDLGAWAAERQADMLLYLGSFFLVIAAVIFVAYQGDALAPVLRVALLLVYTAAFVVAGLLVQRWALVREAGRVLLALGALLTPLNFVLLHIEVLGDRGVSADVVWLIGSAYSTTFYGALARRGGESLYSWLSAFAGLSAWAALASVLGIPSEWVPAWFMAGALALTIVLIGVRRLGEGALWSIGTTATIAAFGAILAAFSESHRAQLPVTYILLTSIVVLVGYHLRVPKLLPLASTTALAAVLASLWSVEAPFLWFGYPMLALGTVTLASKRWWAAWDDDLVRFGWVYVGGLALTAAFIVSWEATSGHAAVTYLGGSALLAAVTSLNHRLGAFRDPDKPAGVDAPTSMAERATFGWGAFVLLLASVWSAQEWFGVESPNDGWAFTGVSVVGAGALAWLARRDARLEWWLLPAVLTATLAALQAWDVHVGHNAGYLAISATGIAAAAAWSRLWGRRLSPPSFSSRRRPPHGRRSPGRRGRWRSRTAQSALRRSHC